ncbi:hypothetical protein DFQ29_004812 [Apophysomyces sp. BC1021]|nr:hypothetical protein DFQ29_004812 [Apophysomyces sp. BC1021]
MVYLPFILTALASAVGALPHIAPDFKAASHPAFPKYEMQYTHPSRLCDPHVKQTSGYLGVGDFKHFFFWAFESRNDPKNDPIILWLNGGPGCSSLTGLFMELGPCTVNLAGNTSTVNKYSWNNNATVIFLDQPANVGYSYGYADTSDSFGAGRDIYVFLQVLFKQFPAYAHLDFHIAGESYAGHYIPAVASIIQQGNKALAKKLVPINLKSLMIGNGLIDPLIQYRSFKQMGCDNEYGKVLTTDTCRTMEEATPRCEEAIRECYRTTNTHDCVGASSVCNLQLLKPYLDTGLNPYDVTKKCSGGNLCYDILYSVQTYLNRPEIAKAVGSQVKSFQSCNKDINHSFQMAGDWMRPYVQLLPEILNSGTRLLIYAGDADYVCNWVGNKAWTLELPWEGQEEYTAASDRVWHSSSGMEAGEVRATKDGRLTFLRVYKAGHMVPYDQPAHALDMVKAWIQGGLH